MHLRRCRAWTARVAVVATALAIGAPAAIAAPVRPSVAIPVEISIGGPYRTVAGQPVTLSATFAVKGQSATVSKLAAIGAALLAYQDAYGTFPPSALTDAAGRPTVSWRVLLLPFLGQKSLYDRFDLTKSWDDPVNRPLLSEMPDVYRTAGGNKASTWTGVAGVAGTQQLFRGAASSPAGGLKPSRITDGTTMTTAVGPVGSKVRIPWTAPGDIETSAKPRFGASSGFDGPGAVATPMLFADGQVRTLLDSVDAVSVHSWSTVDTGGCLPPDEVKVDLRALWDLDGSGLFSSAGRSATFAATTPGVHKVTLRVVDNFGGVRTVRTTVTVR